MSDILITGMARSGTSMVCALLNTAPNCVALVEPMAVPQHGDRARAVDDIAAFVAGQRRRILGEGVARSAHVEGTIPDNTFAPVADGGTLRASRIAVGDVAITKPLTPDFRLFIKHPAMFTALAPELSARLPLFAVVRDPLAALASWQTVDIPIHYGRWPAAERFSPDLAVLLDGIDDRLARQVALIGWIFRAYARLPRHRVITYEAVMADPSAALVPLVGRQVALAHRLERFDLAARYPGVDLAALARGLVPVAPVVEPFYPGFEAGLAARIS